MLKPSRKRTGPQELTGIKIATFVSPHGFGHAARAAAVMEALGSLVPSVSFDIFTRVPRWFFEDSLTVPFVYHDLMTDIGMVQKTALQTDLAETVSALNAFLPFPAELVEGVAAQLRKCHCQIVLCDIAPLGIVAAQATGLPSVLVENFTWDWIYQYYLSKAPSLTHHVHYLKRVFSAASVHIQTKPVCNLIPEADLVTGPVSRRTRTPRAMMRQHLGIPAGKKAVLVTMGGVGETYTFFDRVSHREGLVFVVSDGSEEETRHKNLILLPRRSSYYLPDLVNACDAVIGKVGYSTLAEVFQGGVPFGYVARPDFPESQKLTAFVEKHMKGMMIENKSWRDESWLDILDELLLRGPKEDDDLAPRANGADEIARFIAPLVTI